MPNASGSSSSRRSGPPRGRSGSSQRGSKPGGSRGKSSGGPRGNGSRGGAKGGNSRGRSNDRDGRNSERRDSRDGRRDSSDTRGDARGKDSRGGPRGNSSNRGGRDGYKGRKRDERPKKPARAERSGWGSVAQHGAAGATIGQRMFEEESGERFSPEERRKFAERQARRDKIAARNEGLREQARQAIDRGGLPDIDNRGGGDKLTVERRPLPGRPPKPMDVQREMSRIAGKEKGPRSWRLFKRAAKEYENEQFQDSHKTTLPLTERYPKIADLHELHGLSLYRLGRWDEAIEALETFRLLSGTAEQNPVLMDCHRALGNWADVDYLWTELGELSPSAELVTEGRIVMAGSQADRGLIDSGVRTLEKGWKIPKHPMEHHLRRAYALADLLERDGKLPKSRKLFAWVAEKDPAFGDAAQRAT